MTEIRFYHLEGRTAESVLPSMLERALERGWRAVVQASSDERIEALDAHLWTYKDDGFLPHGVHPDSAAADQPILLTVRNDNPNGSNVRFLIDRAPMPPDAPAYELIAILFDGADREALDEARDLWRAAKAQGFAVAYWQADEQGRWRQGA